MYGVMKEILENYERFYAKLKTRFIFEEKPKIFF